jgi:NAD(P)-dependent dehydrogenase (short-subunit alcohol dehydrogenase family)
MRARSSDEAPVAVITGAGGELGGAIAQVLADNGARLLLADISSEALDRVQRQVDRGDDIAVLAGDATKAAAPVATFDAAVERFGAVDVLVNNAGIEGPVDRLEDLGVDDVRRLFEINVFAMLSFSAEAMRRFRPQGYGRIVNMASGAGTAGTGLMSAYSASKHAAVGLTRSLAVEAAGGGIQVNAVCPGCVDSPMMSRIEQRIEEIESKGPVSFVSSIPSGSYCSPQEIGELVGWLALDAPDNINGTIQIIDGAMRA